MSFAFIPERVIDKWSTMSSSAKNIAVTIASYMGNNNQQCYPSITTLMSRSGLKNRKTVRKAIKELTEKKLMTVEKRNGKSNLYSWTQPPVKNTGGAKNTTSNKCPPTPRKECGGTPGNNCTPKDIKKDIKKDTNRGTKEKDGCQSKINGGVVWKWWVAANRSVGRRDPMKHGPDLNTAKSLAKQIADNEITQEELLSSMTAFLSDSDKFLCKNGHGLRLLPGRMNAYLNPGAVLNSEAVQREKEFESASSNYGNSGLEDTIAEQDVAADVLSNPESSRKGEQRE